MSLTGSGEFANDDGVIVARVRVAVVGRCASGKSTLVAALQELGVDAYAVAQEHSAVPTLWQHADPDLLIYLDVDLETIRSRRSPG